MEADMKRQAIGRNTEHTVTRGTDAAYVGVDSTWT